MIQGTEELTELITDRETTPRDSAISCREDHLLLNTYVTPDVELARNLPLRL